MDSVTIALFEKLAERGWLLATAESCTGGMIAVRITDVPGSSSYFDRGFVTYTNEAKTDMLAVPPAIIEEHGAVSIPVAEAMARGALEHSNADIAVSVTGVAGPGGGTAEKPVGLVFIGVATWDKVDVYEHRFGGERAQVRAQTVDAAMRHLLDALT